MTTLLLAEHDNARLNDSTRKALTAALALGTPVHVLVAGHGCGAVAEAAARLGGIGKVHVADAPAYADALAEPLAALLQSLADHHDAFVAVAGSTGKNALPRLAALLDVMQVSDVTKVVAPDTFERPIYAGNAVQTVRVRDAKTVMTVRTAAFAATPDGPPVPIEPVAPAADPGRSRFVGADLTQSARPELGGARIVVSGGRALGSAERFRELVEPLSDALGAAVGASRAAVDAGYAPNDYQVGQTGKVVSPELYVALGISGAIQHLAGMKDSKTIVAVNKDADAPIFQVADYGLVADIFQAVPELTRAIARAKGRAAP